MGKKRKVPLRTDDQVRSMSSQTTQRIISEYHTLLKRRKQITSRPGHERDATSIAELQEVEDQMRRAGGLAAYQKASQLGQSARRGGDTSKILIPWLETRRSRWPSKLR